MNNTKTKGHQNANLKISDVPGLIHAITIRETALYRLEGPLESH